MAAIMNYNAINREYFHQLISIILYYVIFIKQVF